jgi:hypothetical protein
VSRTPFLVAARKLLELGYSPHETIVMRHRGSELDCLTSTLGERRPMPAVWPCHYRRFRSA